MIGWTVNNEHMYRSHSDTNQKWRKNLQPSSLKFRLNGEVLLPPGVTTAQSADTTVTEGDSSDTTGFTVALDSQPKQAVTVTVTAAAGLELDGPDSSTTFSNSEGPRSPRITGRRRRRSPCGPRTTARTTRPGGVAALLAPETIPETKTPSGNGGWSQEAAYGISRGRGMVGSPYTRLSGTSRVEITRLGYRIEPDADHAADMNVDLWAEPKTHIKGEDAMGASLGWQW